MSQRKRNLVAGAVALGVLVLAGAALVYSRRPGGRTKADASSLPYYKRTGFLSEFLQDVHAGPPGIESITVPPGFEVSEAAKAGMVTYPMFISFDDRGRLFVCESAGRNIGDEEMRAAPEMRIRLLEDTNGDGAFDRSTIFADRITMTMGAQWYRGSLYVAAPPDILKFEDTNGDGVADRRDVLLTGWPLHSNGTTLHGPYLGPDGWMYLTYNVGKYNIKTKEGTTLVGPGGRVFRFRPDGTGLEWFIGGGYDNGIEMAFNEAGEMFGTMTYYRNPRMGERDALLHYVEGAVFPKPHPIADTYKRTGDLMPAMTKFARVAPAGLLYYRGNAFGDAYRGNLFSALFNPHRILRHAMERTGGTFQTKDEDFLVSRDPDFHPTDVTEDADGSLLVVETGAWYLHSCPVSRIAKPEYKGAIYRVRRTGAPRVADPWGLAMKLESKTPEELSPLLGDDRPAVRDKAADLLVQAGERATAPLIAIREKHAAPDVRAAAVFALSRIGTEQAAGAVRAALNDADFVVRIAAARQAGRSQDRAAVDKLMEMVQRDRPGARRQAATALGQIGDPKAVPALVTAAGTAEDRFVEHSIIYSLIQLKTPGPVLNALRSPNPKARKAALIALDQMDGSPLRREQLARNLNDADPDLRRAAFWLVSRHPAWSQDLLNALGTQFRRGGVPPEESESVKKTLASLCSGAEAQKWIADTVGDAAVREPERLFLLDVMEGCSMPRVPDSWIEQLRRQIHGSNPAVRARVVNLLRSRQIAALDGDMQRLAADPAEAATVRVTALGVLAPRLAPLPDQHFAYLMSLLRPETDADLRQSAAQTLGRARLTEGQLMKIADERLGQADPLILPHLLNAFRQAKNEQVGAAMVGGLMKSQYAAEGIVAQHIPEMLKTFPTTVQSKAAPLLARIASEKDQRAARLHQLEPLLRGGDIHRGREVFFGKKAGCSSCHTIMSDGADVGPDLTGVGGVRSGLDLLEAVVYPSASFVPGHEVYRVETDREVYTGVRGDGGRDEVVIISGPNDRIHIPRKEVRSMRSSPVSLMPDGFADNLTREELSDLLAFLQAQKARTPSTAPAAGVSE
jgi:putative membrane-bound dehydrogenase-like protein